MIKRSHFTSITVGFITLFVLVGSVSADLWNGDFSPDLSYWEISNGPVDLWDGTFPADPSIADSSIDVPAAWFHPDWLAEDSTLSQGGITIDPEFPVLSFDVYMETEFPGETDTFTASLSFLLEGEENVVTFYSLGSNDSRLTDEDGNGKYTFSETFPYDVSSIGAGEVRLTFNLNHDNSIDDGYTFVLLDNVELVPIPSAVFLGGLGLTFSGWLLYRRR